MTKVYLAAFQERVPKNSSIIAQQWDIEIIGLYEFAIVNPEFTVITVLEEGRQAGIIRAKNKKFLRFKKPKIRKSTYRKIPGNQAFEKDGYIYAKAVNHPGFEARRYIEKLLNDEALYSEFQETFVQHLITSL